MLGTVVSTSHTLLPVIYKKSARSTIFILQMRKIRISSIKNVPRITKLVMGRVRT